MASNPPIVAAAQSLQAELASFQAVLDATAGALPLDLENELSGPLAMLPAALDKISTIYDADDDTQESDGTRVPAGFREAFRRGRGIVFDFGDD